MRSDIINTAKFKPFTTWKKLVPVGLFPKCRYGLTFMWASSSFTPEFISLQQEGAVSNKQHFVNTWQEHILRNLTIKMTLSTSRLLDDINLLHPLAHTTMTQIQTGPVARVGLLQISLTLDYLWTNVERWRGGAESATGLLGWLWQWCNIIITWRTIIQHWCYLNVTASVATADDRIAPCCSWCSSGDGVNVKRHILADLKISKWFENKPNQEKYVTSFQTHQLIQTQQNCIWVWTFLIYSIYLWDVAPIKENDARPVLPSYCTICLWGSSSPGLCVSALWVSELLHCFLMIWSKVLAPVPSWTPSLLC